MRNVRPYRVLEQPNIRSVDQAERRGVGAATSEDISRIVAELLSSIPSRKLISIERGEIAIASLQAASNALWLALDSTVEDDLRKVIIEQGRAVDALLMASEAFLSTVRTLEPAT